MKKFAILAAILLFPTGLTLASTVVRTGDSISVAENQTVAGNYYGIGGSVALSGMMEGDTALAGGNVTVGGSVLDDLFVLGGTVSQQASVTEDVRIIAGDVTVSGPIGGSLVILAGRVNVLSSATIAGDVLVYGGEATIDAAVGGQILGNTDRLRINGSVGKGIDVTSRHLVLGEQANITGDVVYVSMVEMVRAPAAVVTGNVQKNDVVSEAATTHPLRSVAIMALMSLFATLCLYLFSREKIEKFGTMSVERFGLKCLLGFATLLLTPIIVIILLVSVLGVYVGLLGLFLFMLLTILALLLMNVVAGSLVFKVATNKSQVSIISIITGTVIVQGVLLIPVIGMAFFMLFFLATLGAVVWQGYQLVR